MADQDTQNKIHQEGTEHIKDTLEQRHETQGTSQGTDAAAAAPRRDTSIPPAKPPASNPGADDPTAGIPKGSGGLSSTAAVDSPVQSKRNSIFGTLRGFLGIEKKEKEAADADPKNAGTAAGAAATASGAALVAGHTMEIPDRTKVPSDNTETTGAGLGNKETETSAAAAGTAKDATNSKMSDNTETTSKPAEGTGNTEKANEDRAEPSSDKKPAAAGGKPLENRDAIPVAGGEKLGDKHWGESKIVPDNPQASGDQSGISSAEGQPTSEVADNTAKNTGGASAAPGQSQSPSGGNSEEKQKFSDKIKEKLHMGKKDKA